MDPTSAVTELPEHCEWSGMQLIQGRTAGSVEPDRIFREPFNPLTLDLATEAPGSWLVASASACGTSHSATGRGNEDAYVCVVTGDGTLIVAVADGVGSYPGTSAWGSRTAVQAATVHLEQWNAERGPGVRGNGTWDEGAVADAILSAIRFASEELVRVAAELSLSFEELSTTLNIVVADHDRACTGQIGDGIIVIQSDGDCVWVEPENHGGAINEAYVVDHPVRSSDVRIHFHRNVKAIAVSTDGLQYKITDLVVKRPFEPFFEGLWSMLTAGEVDDARLEAFLDSIRDHQTTDDKTLVAAVRREGVARVQQAAYRGESPLPAPAQANEIQG